MSLPPEPPYRVQDPVSHTRNDQAGTADPPPWIGSTYASPRWTEQAPEPQPRPRLWLHTLLFVLTFGSTTAWGVLHYLSFQSRFGLVTPPLTGASVVGGLWYSVSVLLILGCHEMGHYLACRYYRVAASLPYFLPAPIVISGTFGAVIRIREPFPHRKALFDVGIAGPLAGFAVLLPALFLGLNLSTIERLPATFSGYSLGEPLLFRAAAWLVFGAVQDGFSINLHPLAFAAWLGLIITALNLLPIGQLDGGHVTYATLGHRRSRLVTIGSYLAVLALVAYYRSLTLLVFAGVVGVILFLTGGLHPATRDDEIGVGQGRRLLAVVALVILVLSFTPAPMEIFELLPR